MRVWAFLVASCAPLCWAATVSYVGYAHIPGGARQRLFVWARGDNQFGHTHHIHRKSFVARGRGGGQFLLARGGVQLGYTRDIQEIPVQKISVFIEVYVGLEVKAQ